MMTKRIVEVVRLVAVCAAIGVSAVSSFAAAASVPPVQPAKAAAGAVVVSGSVSSPTLAPPAPAPAVPAVHGGAEPAREGARQILLMSDGADPELIATLRRTLEQLGATVIVVPVSGAGPGGAVSASQAAYAPVSASPARQAVVWDGQLRYRYESRTLFDYRLPGTFGRAASQTLGERGDVSLMRTRVGAGVLLAPRVRGYVNVQDARTMGAEGSPGGTLSNVDLYNAWVDLDSLGGVPVSARIGRQVLAYGEGRILTGADWANAGRGYDGMRVRWSQRALQADGFITWINEGRLGGNDRVLAGADVLWRGPNGLEAEAYHVARQFGDMAYTGEHGQAGGLFDATTGLRTRALRGRIELRAEGAIQRGRRADEGVQSWFGVAKLTADLHSVWRTRLSLEHLRASGDPSPTDGRFQRFDPVYWGGHNFQGAIDVVAASNVADWCAGLVTQPAPAWTIQSELHTYTLASATDAWVDDGGTVLRHDPTGSAGRRLGQEADLLVKWEARPKVLVSAGVSRFMSGPYVRATGGGGDESWGFLQLTVSF